MLNIGPRANGEVPYEIAQRMLEMGKWLEVNGESIYGAQAFDLHKDQHDWGKITCKKTLNGFKLFLHVYTWPLNKKLNLTGVKAKLLLKAAGCLPGFHFTKLRRAEFVI